MRSQYLLSDQWVISMCFVWNVTLQVVADAWVSVIVCEMLKGLKAEFEALKGRSTPRALCPQLLGPPLPPPSLETSWPQGRAGAALGSPLEGKEV